MGYTDVHTSTLLGLGVSGISETPDCYHQNEKVLTLYERRVRAGEIPTLRGHVLSAEDRRRRAEDRRVDDDFRRDARSDRGRAGPQALESLLEDGLVQLHGETLTVPADGRPFLRNAAAFFDEYLGREQAAGPTYSSSV